MQEYPEHFQTPTEPESDETPNWVADSGSQTWQAKDQNSFVRASNVALETTGAGQTAELVYAPGFVRVQGQNNPNWRQDSTQNFYENGTPTAPTGRFYTGSGGKPYQTQGNRGILPPPIGIPFPEETPLDEQVIPRGLPLPDADPRKLETRPTLPEKYPGVFTDGKSLLIPTFSLTDPDLSEKFSPRSETYDINSPEAKLYLENRDSIVKITTVKVNAQGNNYNAFATGFFVTENGQIATANHVVDGATSIKVVTASGKSYDARVGEIHPGSESAMIELTNVAAGEKFRPIPLRDNAADLAPGEKLTVLGHPNGVDEIVMSKGAFTSRERFAGSPFSWPGVNPSTMFIHASTRIQGGNSGGPLLDSHGRAVGLTNFRHGDNSGEFVGIDDVRSMVNDPKRGQLSDQRSYILPSSLQFDKDVAWKAVGPLLTLAGGGNAYVGRNATRLVLANGAARSITSGMAGAYAISEMPSDYSAFKSAWEQGTTAEKVNAGINLGGDLLMVTGSAAAILSRRYAVIGTALSTIGAGSKLGNAVLGDRRYH